MTGSAKVGRPAATCCDHVCQSPKFLVASICDLPDVINCQFREFAAALLGPVHFLSPDQQSGIHCLIICVIQLLTPNNLGGTWRPICLLDIRSVSAIEVLSNRTLQINVYLLTYMKTGHSNTNRKYWTAINAFKLTKINLHSMLWCEAPLSSRQGKQTIQQGTVTLQTACEI